MKKQTVLKKSGRIVHELPWLATSTKPWSKEHIRVLIPLSASERINSDKPFHVQIVRKDNLKQVSA